MLRVRPIKVCPICNGLYRLGARESIEQFAQRKYCSPQCAGVALMTKARAEIVTNKQVTNTKVKPIRAPRKRPTYPRKRSPAATPAVEPTPPVHHAVQAGYLYRERTWEVAQWEGPSEQLRAAASRYARAHGIRLKDALAMWGYHPRTWRDL